MPLVYEYVNADGSNPFRVWFDSLSAPAAAKIATAKARVEAGHTASLKSVGDGLLEYVIDWGPGYRMYLARSGSELIVLFGGGSKSRQRNDIREAKALLTEFRMRKKNAETNDRSLKVKKSKSGKDDSDA